MQLFDAAGRQIALGREIARGGEGAVVEVSHDAGIVAKVYHQAVDRDKVAKLSAMARLADPRLLKVAAWPTDTLHETRGGGLVGVLMPKVIDHREVHQLYSPAERKLHFPKADWSFLAHVAMNCAAAFETVHSCGHIIGDVNQSGVLAAARGTVHLIDCDSFQIKTNGRFFPCIVGVPQYTPPELQGQNFRAVERTQNHDAFGLALIIFHLLFMGRHPFAGRFSGSGDMPIERAISEGRFAFSLLAASNQMTPPPFALPLNVLPPQMTNMFERAFARPTAGSSRPNPSEWRQALTSLKGNLKTCSSDHGHRFPNHLQQCPWCSIMQSGGPNFFISVQVVGSGSTTNFIAIDFTAIWNRIERISAPPNDRPIFPPFTGRVQPRPLPEGVQELQLFRRIVSTITILSVLVAVVGLSLNALLAMLGLGLTIFFGIWWLFLLSFTKLRSEMDGRRAIARQYRAALNQEQVRYDHVADAAANKFVELKASLKATVGQAGQIRSAFEAERRQLDANRREEQLQDFLDSKFIRNARIDNVGPSRRATLLSWNIETAADAQWNKLDKIPGFGPKLIQSIIDWREQIELQFVFDNSRPVPADKIRGVVARYQDLQHRQEVVLTSGERELRAIAEKTAVELHTITNRIATLITQTRQAEADLRAK